jgi:hypothetical protein
MAASPALHAALKSLERAQLSDRLDYSIKRRASVDDLVCRHILLGNRLQSAPPPRLVLDRALCVDTTVAPALQVATRELERAKLSDALEHKLERRLKLSDLVEQNIAKEPLVSPSLQGKFTDLEKAKLGDRLAQLLKHRASADELVEQSILRDTKVAPMLQPKLVALERAMASDTLASQMKHRIARELPDFATHRPESPSVC